MDGLWAAVSATGVKRESIACPRLRQIRFGRLPSLAEPLDETIEKPFGRVYDAIERHFLDLIMKIAGVAQCSN
jgi:hypothetical protein